MINRASPGPIGPSPSHFSINLARSKYWYDLSEGYFDVSIQPLIDYWGFGKDRRGVLSVDSVQVTSLQRWVGLDKWYDDSGVVYKQDERQQLVFDAIAKGYAVDVIATWLEARGVRDYLVDIGGEAKAKGLNASQTRWKLGINIPSYTADMTDVLLAIEVADFAVASSGNYRNYHEMGDKKYGHTIDPTTGYPYQDSLLAITVIAQHCIDADAVATACMAMGYAKASTFISSLSQVEACAIVASSNGTLDTKFTDGFIQYVASEQSTEDL